MARGERRGCLYRFFYWIFSAVVVIGAVFAYYLWFQRTEDSKVPELVTAMAYVYEYEQPVEAVLLWSESLVKSPSDGMLQLVHGGRSAHVGKGDAVAFIRDGKLKKNVTVNAPERGYFLPFYDGAEGSWIYSNIWPGSGFLPEAPRRNFLRDLSELPKDRVVGKIIPVPQQLRAIFYVDVTESLLRDIGRGFVDVKFTPGEAVFRCNVRVKVEMGARKCKLYVDLPVFPMNLTDSRTLTFYVRSGQQAGVLVPESALSVAGGSYVVFELVGRSVIKREVAGSPMDDGKFFIRQGVNPGSILVLDALSAKEGVVQLW